MASEKFNKKLGLIAIQTIMKRLSFSEKLIVSTRYIIELSKLKKNSPRDNFLSESKIAKQQRSLFAMYSALRSTIGEEHALRTMFEVIQSTSGEAFVGTLQEFYKMVSMDKKS
jgi:hypothetical protein